MCLCVYVCPCESRCPKESDEGIDTLDLKLQESTTCLMWMLGSDLRCSVGVVHAFNL